MNIYNIVRNSILNLPIVPNRLRIRALRVQGLQIGSGSVIASGATLKGVDIQIGQGVFINHECYVDRGPLQIHDNVNIGPRVMFATRNHEIGAAERRAGIHVDQKIVVGSGVWIGGGAIVLGGVNVASGCVIAAGSVVVRSTEPNGLYAGVPARRLKEI